MDRTHRPRNRVNFSLQMKSSSLYFLNDIRNFNSTENLTSDVSNWRDSYTFNPVILGRGHFSKVYKAKCTSTGKYVAIKVIRRRRLGVDKLDDIMKEIEIMQLLNQSTNSAFIQLLKFHTSVSEVAVLMEFASGGSIYNVIRESETGLPEAYTKIILSKVISALCIMHAQNIVHLDIKADNILLRHPYPSTDVALADFGLARKLSKSKVHKEMIGTPDYIAPEVANYDSISTQSDMWSVGVLTYFILTNISPFFADTKEETLNRVSKTQFEFLGQLKNDNLQAARDFIKNLLIKIPEKRIRAEDCHSHAFLSSVPLVEYPISQNSEKAIPTIIVAPDTDCSPQVRENTNYKVRALVTSQYNIESSYDSAQLENRKKDLLEPDSVNCLPIVNMSNDYFDPQIDYDNVNSRPILVEACDNLENEHILVEALNEQITDNSEIQNGSDNPFVGEPLELVCEALDNSNEPTNSLSENFIINNKKNDCEDFTNISVDCPEIIMDDINLSFVKHEKVSDSSRSTSSMDTNNANSSSSNSIKNDLKSTVIKRESFQKKSNVKVNSKLYNNEKINNIKRLSTKKTKENDYKGRIKTSVESSQMKSDSFRYSRDNLVDPNFLIMYGDDDFMNQKGENYDDSSFRDYNTIPLRGTTCTVKKRHLSKSVKRNFDKPSENPNRISQIITSENNFHSLPNYGINLSKSHPNLNITRSESSKRVKNSVKISEIFKSKNNKKFCIIS